MLWLLNLVEIYFQWEYTIKKRIKCKYKRGSPRFVWQIFPFTSEQKQFPRSFYIFWWRYLSHTAAGLDLFFRKGSFYCYSSYCLLIPSLSPPLLVPPPPPLSLSKYWIGRNFLYSLYDQRHILLELRTLHGRTKSKDSQTFPLIILDKLRSKDHYRDSWNRIPKV